MDCAVRTGAVQLREQTSRGASRDKRANEFQMNVLICSSFLFHPRTRYALVELISLYKCMLLYKENIYVFWYVVRNLHSERMYSHRYVLYGSSVNKS